MHRRFAVGAACAAAAMLSVSALLGATPALAHSQLVASTPAADETLSEAPEFFSITMNEDLLDLAGDGTGFGLQVLDADGRYFGDGCLTIDGPNLSMGATLGEPGQYRLVYQVVSDDGHPVSAEFGFTWTGQPTGPGSDTPPVCGQTVTTFPPSPTAAPQPTDTREPGASATGTPTPEEVGSPVVPIVIGAAGVLALAAVIAFAIVRQRRIRE